MKRLLASLLLVGTLGFAGVALSEEPMPAPAPAAATTEAAPAPDAAAMPAEAAPAEAAPAPAAEAPKLDSGNTAWMLTSTALVLVMTIPGLALFYGGMVRKKNVLGTMMQSFAITAMITVLWMIVG
ncbi:MAG: ammonium transporter, partial [Thiobacillus sp.]|nr:ammonium transporter [Thiobacillus sp.]